ncbi:MAG: hypothetical protein BZY88_01810 [SAR202 cluster bacterium Io17-Chloro-G9]|nr:MAG: hypothetical protein BZY88_01810 [SAR202 cluster bacterium Io17-Chloro-G9]
MATQQTKDQILKELTEKAIALWGHDRVQNLKASLEQTATHLWEIGQADPETGVEPGFFQ